MTLAEKWSASERAQRKRMIQFLQETIRALEQQDAEEKPVRRPAKTIIRRRRRKLVAA